MLTATAAVALFLLAFVVIARDEWRTVSNATQARERATQRAQARATRQARNARAPRSEAYANEALATSARGHHLYRATVRAMHDSRRP